MCLDTVLWLTPCYVLCFCLDSAHAHSCIRITEMMKYLLLEEMLLLSGYSFSFLGSQYYLWKDNLIDENNNSFFFLQLTQAIKGKDEQKDICFFTLQDFKKKKLELLLPTGNTMHGKWSNGKQKSNSTEMLLFNYVFYLLPWWVCGYKVYFGTVKRTGWMPFMICVK